MSQLLVEKKQIVVPGEVLAEGMDYLPGKGTVREKDNIIATRLGLLDANGSIVSIIPLSGCYTPKRDDTVIGQVKDIAYNMWFIDINYAYDGLLLLKEATSDFVERGASLSDYYAIGDFILVNVLHFTKEGSVELTMLGPGLRKLHGGKIIEISPTKIPRVVGKQGSMVSLIKEHTGCSIFAGQNGRVWIRGPSPEAEKLATDAIHLIEKKAHISGLTETVKAFLEQGGKKQ